MKNIKFKKVILFVVALALLSASLLGCSPAAYARLIYSDFSEVLSIVQIEETLPSPPEALPDPTTALDPTEPMATEAVLPTEAAQAEQVVYYETVHAISPVNVRSGPSTEHEILGVLEARENVQRLTVCDNGWSKVIYHDTEAYVSTKYLVKTEYDVACEDVPGGTIGERTPGVSIPSGNGSDPYIGKFTIPSTAVAVNCYGSNSQATVDASNSAAMFFISGHTTIADHVNQGFSGIKACKAGTKAYFDTGAGKKEYTCVDVINGHNIGQGLTDANYNSIADLYPGTLVCYTCNGNSRNITIVFFSSGDGIEQTDDPLPNIVSESGSRECHGDHMWSSWEIAWEVIDARGNYYGWNKRICKLCHEEDWVPRTQPSANCPLPENSNGDEDDATDGSPIATTTPEETVPPAVTPVDPVPEETVSSDVVPTDPIPEETVSSDEVPADPVPGDTSPAAPEPPSAEDPAAPPLEEQEYPSQP